MFLTPAEIMGNILSVFIDKNLNKSHFLKNLVENPAKGPNSNAFFLH
jgi:hypothetical protein